MDLLCASGRRVFAQVSRRLRPPAPGAAPALSGRWLPAPLLAGLLPAALVVVLTLSGQALAHQVNVFAVAESGMLRGEGYFGGGAKARDCAVEAVDATGAVVASGRSGQDGTFALALPAPVAAPLTVVLKAGEGHRGDYTLTAADLGAMARSTPSTSNPASPSPAAESAQAASPKGAPPDNPKTGISTPSNVAAGSTAATAAAAPASASTAQAAPQAPPGGASPCQDDARLAALMEAAAAKAVEERLAPLKLELARLAAREDSARFKDLIGGLGWIAGLLGLAAWLKRPKS